MATAPIIDRQLLEKLERLAIRWQRSFRGLVGGHNASKYSGPGQEFLDHRNFHPGDDLRAVNWRAYMRLDKLFLKMFQVEPRTPIRILLDTSVSMLGGAEGGLPVKFDYARQLAAALVYIGLVRHDTIMLQPFDGHLKDPAIASGGRHRFGPISDFLTALEPAGKTNYFEMTRQFISAYTRPGLLILLSDYLDDGDCLRPLQYLADFGHELMLIQLWTDNDRSPGWDGDVALLDVETGGKLEIALDADSRGAYTEAFDKYAESIAQLALRNGGRYVGLSTSTPLDEAVFQAVSRTGAA